MTTATPDLQRTFAFRDQIQKRFEKFHADNPHVYGKIVELARQLKARGRERYSIASLFERLRWHYSFETDCPEPFKISNDYRSRYARLVMKQEPDLEGFFDLRGIRSN